MKSGRDQSFLFRHVEHPCFHSFTGPCGMNLFIPCWHEIPPREPVDLVRCWATHGLCHFQCCDQEPSLHVVGFSVVAPFFWPVLLGFTASEDWIVEATTMLAPDKVPVAGWTYVGSPVTAMFVSEVMLNAQGRFCRQSVGPKKAAGTVMTLPLLSTKC